MRATRQNPVPLQGQPGAEQVSRLLPGAGWTKFRACPWHTKAAGPAIPLTLPGEYTTSLHNHPANPPKE